MKRRAGLSTCPHSTLQCLCSCMATWSGLLHDRAQKLCGSWQLLPFRPRVQSEGKGLSKDPLSLGFHLDNIAPRGWGATICLSWPSSWCLPCSCRTEYPPGDCRAAYFASGVEERAREKVRAVNHPLNLPRHTGKSSHVVQGAVDAVQE